MERTMTRWAARTGATLALTLLLPAAAQAATAPGVTTGGAANVQQHPARLTATVAPTGADTQCQFQDGPTGASGSATPEAPVGGGGRKAATADISALAPATKYH